MAPFPPLPVGSLAERLSVNQRLNGEQDLHGHRRSRQYFLPTQHPRRLTPVGLPVPTVYSVEALAGSGPGCLGAPQKRPFNAWPADNLEGRS